MTARDNRLFVEAVLYRYRVGIPWSDFPERFGDFPVVHTRFSRWSKSGVWQRIFRKRDGSDVSTDLTRDAKVVPITFAGDYFGYGRHGSGSEGAAELSA